MNKGFDIVIGNPPYIKNQEIEKDEKSIYQEIYEETSGQFDLFGIFLQRNIRLINERGYIGQIISELFLKGLQHKNLREYLLKKVDIKKVKSLGGGIFREVVMPTCILIYKNEKKKSNKIEFESNRILQSDLFSTPFCVFNPEIGEIYNQIDTYCDDLEDLVCKDATKRGLEIGNNKTAKNRRKKSDIPIFSGGDMHKYIPQSVSYISDDIYKRYKKDDEIFSAPKLMVRETGSNLGACIDNTGIISMRTVFNIHIDDANRNILFVLTLLNSAFLQKIYELAFRQGGEEFPKIRNQQVLKLPIRKVKFVTPKSKMHRIITDLKRKTRNFLKSGDQENIIDIINLYHRSEQTDIIHNFLVYLAQKMIILVDKMHRGIDTEKKTQKLQMLIDKTISVLYHPK